MIAPRGRSPSTTAPVPYDARPDRIALYGTPGLGGPGGAGVGPNWWFPMKMLAFSGHLMRGSCSSSSSSSSSSVSSGAGMDSGAASGVGSGAAATGSGAAAGSGSGAAMGSGSTGSGSGADATGASGSFAGVGGGSSITFALVGAGSIGASPSFGLDAPHPMAVVGQSNVGSHLHNVMRFYSGVADHLTTENHSAPV